MGSEDEGGTEWRCRRLLTPSPPQHFVPRTVSMAAAWRPVSVSVRKPGEGTTAPVVSGW